MSSPITFSNAAPVKTNAEAAPNSPSASAGQPGPPVLNPGSPRMLALGLDGLIALLSEDGAKQMRRDARENQRAERDSQLSAINRQVGELYEKASAMRSEAGLTAALGIAGGLAQVGGAAAGAGTGQGASKAAIMSAQGGKTVSDVSGPIGKWAYGGEQIKHEAEATRAASDAKRAESAADEYGSLMKSADATIDKAHQALQALAQMRSQLMASHGVYRPM